jgi:hypothetical protein
MFTKKDFAEYILKEYAKNEGISVKGIKANLSACVYASTRVGIALEELGLLNEHKALKEYLSEREGVWLMYIPDKKEIPIPTAQDIKQMSIREMFSLLPDNI